jgi:hypothetical protein
MYKYILYLSSLIYQAIDLTCIEGALETASVIDTLSRFSKTGLSQSTKATKLSMADNSNPLLIEVRPILTPSHNP